MEEFYIVMSCVWYVLFLAEGIVEWKIIKLEKPDYPKANAVMHWSAMIVCGLMLSVLWPVMFLFYWFTVFEARLTDLRLERELRKMEAK